MSDESKKYLDENGMCVLLSKCDIECLFSIPSCQMCPIAELKAENEALVKKMSVNVENTKSGIPWDVIRDDKTNTWYERSDKLLEFKKDYERLKSQHQDMAEWILFWDEHLTEESLNILTLNSRQLWDELIKKLDDDE